PIVGLLGGYEKVIYPYNSCSILSSIFGNSLLIIHDFIPNKKYKEKKSLSALYILFSQYFHELMNRDVAFVSKTTMRLAKNVAAIKGCDLYYFPNSFYLLDNIIKHDCFDEHDKGKYVFLISGSGENKEFKKALKLYKNVSDKVHLKVLGFGNDNKLAKDIISEVDCDNVELLPLISDHELLKQIYNSSFVWAHSTAEGFGRPLIEGRMCARPILATNISAFREHKDQHIYLYNLDNTSDFLEMFNSALKDNAEVPFINTYHVDLEKEVSRWL
ncbi:hypothetical protein C0W42_21260, partial [Photobacterium kishitanii]|uniref:glycosyltransferase n=1 Tax=Photobacterium kishitanii TaxID=318456 RepID=UPI000D15F11E